jgi:hypothetical protein
MSLPDADDIKQPAVEIGVDRRSMLFRFLRGDGLTLSMKMSVICILGTFGSVFKAA